MKKNIESLCLQTSPLAQFNGQRACVVGFRSDRVEVEIEVGQSYVMVGNSCVCDHFGDTDGVFVWIFLRMMVSPKEWKLEKYDDENCPWSKVLLYQLFSTCDCLSPSGMVLQGFCPSCVRDMLEGATNDKGVFEQRQMGPRRLWLWNRRTSASWPWDFCPQIADSPFDSSQTGCWMLREQIHRHKIIGYHEVFEE